MDAASGEAAKEARVPTPYRDTEPLGDEECRRLLGAAGIGRVAFTLAALPAIGLVSYTVSDDVVMIPTRAGSDLSRAARGAVVAFQADSYDALRHTGWSVTVVGPSQVLPAERAADPEGCLVAIRMSVVRGLRGPLTRSGPDAGLSGRRTGP